jgi:hypothetical protein
MLLSPYYLYSFFKIVVVVVVVVVVVAAAACVRRLDLYLSSRPIYPNVSL